MQFYLIDQIIIGCYFLIIIYLGIFRNRDLINSEKDFILSGRKLSLTGFIATLVTTWYGAILGIGENTFLYGIQTWFIFSFPYYIFALVYAILIAPRIRKGNNISIPDQFRSKYGESAGIMSALILSFLTSPAPYILSLGLIIQFMFGIELGISLMIATIISVMYVWKGGFSAIVRTDILQFALMFGGFILLLVILWIEVQNPISMIKSLPKKYLDPLGGNSLQYCLAWFFIAAWTFIDPGFFQRCAAAKSPKIAQKGILISIIFWTIFDFLTITCALYAIGLLGSVEASITFPILAIEILPIGIFGIFITGIIATLMSTIDSLSLLSAISFGRDILWRIQGNQNNPNTIPFIRKGLVIISFLSLILAYTIPSIVQLFYTIGSVLIPGLILPFLHSLLFNDSPVNGLSAVKWMAIPIIISMSWYVVSIIYEFPFLGIEPFYPGILGSISYFSWYKIRHRYGN
tara:strand:- start:2703 stop:4088 length:1386 start_codon:yes stop_codon:yes gene_type:complete